MSGEMVGGERERGNITIGYRIFFTSPTLVFLFLFFFLLDGCVITVGLCHVSAVGLFSDFLCKGELVFN